MHWQLLRILTDRQTFMLLICFCRFSFYHWMFVLQENQMRTNIIQIMYHLCLHMLLPITGLFNKRKWNDMKVQQKEKYSLTSQSKITKSWKWPRWKSHQKNLTTLVKPFRKSDKVVNNSIWQRDNIPATCSALLFLK